MPDEQCPTQSRSRRRLVVSAIFVGALVGLFFGAILAYRPLAARYWLSRLRCGDDQAPEKLVPLGRPALHVLLNYVETCGLKEIGCTLDRNFMFYEKEYASGPFWPAAAVASDIPGAEAEVARRMERAADRPEVRARLWVVLTKIDTKSARGRVRDALREGNLYFAGWDPYDGRSAVERALAFLAASQEEEGNWPGVTAWANGASDVRVTSAALLSYLGAGYTQNSGKHRDKARAAQGWLTSIQKSNGQLSDSSLRDHALGALALSESYTMTKVPELKPAVRKALNWSLSRQHSSGGWADTAGGKPDPLTTCLCALQLRSVRVAELGTDLKAWKSTRAFAGKMLSNESLSTSDLPGAMTTWIFMGGDRKDKYLLAAADKLLARPEPVLRAPLESWVACLCFFRLGGERWKKWNTLQKQHLRGTLNRNGPDVGGWELQSAEARRLGPLGSAALRAMNLEVFYRYLGFLSQLPK